MGITIFSKVSSIFQIYSSYLNVNTENMYNIGNIHCTKVTKARKNPKTNKFIKVRHLSVFKRLFFLHQSDKIKVKTHIYLENYYFHREIH